MLHRGATIGTSVVAIATTVCGLLLLGGVGPAVSGTEIERPDVVTPIASTEPATETTTAATSPATTTTSLSTTTSTATSTPTTTIAASTTTTTTTSSTSTSTSTTTTSSTTTPEAAPPAPIPLAVEASTDVVGVGGEVRFDGTCPVGADGPLGPVQVVITPLDRDPPTTVDTGVTAASWTYRWTAPVALADVSSFRFQFWCGDRGGFEGGYPESLERRVDIVASVVATTVPPTTNAPQPAATIPGTN